MHSHRGVGCYQVSITLRWHRCFRQVFINNDVSKPFAGVYERKVVKYIVNELLMPECYLLSVLYTLLPDLSTCTADLFLIFLREAECPKASPPAGYHQPNRPPNTLLTIPTIPPINPPPILPIIPPSLPKLLPISSPISLPSLIPVAMDSSIDERTSSL